MSDKELKPVKDHDQSKSCIEGNLGIEDVNPQQARESTSGSTSSNTEALHYQEPTQKADVLPEHAAEVCEQHHSEGIADSVDHDRHGKSLSSEQKADVAEEHAAEICEKNRAKRLEAQSETSVDHDKQGDTQSNDQKGDVLSGQAAGVSENQNSERLSPQLEASVEKDKEGEALSNKQKGAVLAAEGSEKNYSDSPQPLSLPSTSSSSPLEGAVGGQAAEKQNEASANNDEDYCMACLLPDLKAISPGKVKVFNMFFKDGRYKDGSIKYCTNPDHRTRHNDDQHQSIPVPNQGFSNDRPSGRLQSINPVPKPLLNQAGAIVGTRSGETGEPLVSGSVAENEYSLGSAETMPIDKVYAGNFSPPAPRSEDSNRAASTGSSFPSVSYSPPHAIYVFPDHQLISPLPPTPDGGEPIERRPISSDSMESSSQSSADVLTIRRKRPAGSRPVPIIQSGDSELGGSEGSYSDEKGAVSKPKYSKLSQPSQSDSDRNMHTDSPESESPLQSEDGTLSYSVESDDIQPMPDLVQDIPQLAIDDDSSAGPSRDQQPNEHAGDVEHTNDESSSEPDPTSALSSSPGGSKNDEKQSDES